MAERSGLEKGYVQLYTGNGKGKTTAALGLAMRAAGAGLRTYIGQFMKGQHYSELDAVRMFEPLIEIEQYGQPQFCVPGKVLPEDVGLASAGLEKARAAISGGDYDIVVLDEVCTALYFKLLHVDDILAVMKGKPEKMELILTGRYAPDALIAAADLVTEMKEIKHYYQNEVKSRKGIEN
ncbi:MAG: cob(I)yrinic acid a,c-diamide adenosyltransferase [bacterium]